MHEGQSASLYEQEDSSLVIDPRPMKGFVRTAQVKSVTSRALNYLRAGFPVHFRGPTGTGKTTLALHLAHKLRRPLLLIHGDDQFTSADLTGTTRGYRKTKIVDEFVRGVSKMEESMQDNWVDHRLTVAVREGYTLLYDEFNRSRPEANNILLSILQEGILDFPVSGGKGEVYLRVHPNFRVIFTSNPEEYAGVHKTQDALLDRMVTMDLEHYDHETEVKITSSRSNITREDGEKIVKIVRALRQRTAGGYLPTIRSCIMVGKAVRRYRGALIAKTCEPFREICHDILISEMGRKETREKRKDLQYVLNQLIDEYCPAAVTPNQIVVEDLDNDSDDFDDEHDEVEKNLDDAGEGSFVAATASDEKPTGRVSRPQFDRPIAREQTIVRPSLTVREERTVPMRMRTQSDEYETL